MPDSPEPRDRLAVQQIVPFLRSVVASGERITVGDVDVIEAALAAGVSLSERPPVEPLREAAQAVLDAFGQDDLAQYVGWWYPQEMEALAALRAALAAPAVPPEGHVHKAEYPSSCEGCEWVAADMVRRMPVGLRWTGDELAAAAVPPEEPLREALRLVRSVHGAIGADPNIDAAVHHLSHAIGEASLAAPAVPPEGLRQAVDALPWFDVTLEDGESGGQMIAKHAVLDLIDASILRLSGDTAGGEG